jgi:hypothetical protein
VKQALLSPSNMDKTLKEEAVFAVSEMDSLLNRYKGMFMGLESTLKKALTAAEKERARTCSELPATSPNTQANSQERLYPVVRSSDGPPPTVGGRIKHFIPRGKKTN